MRKLQKRNWDDGREEGDSIDDSSSTLVDIALIQSFANTSLDHTLFVYKKLEGKYNERVSFHRSKKEGKIDDIYISNDFIAYLKTAANKLLIVVAPAPRDRSFRQSKVKLNDKQKTENDEKQ